MTTLSFFGDSRRRESEECAFLAERLERQGKFEDAKAYYRKAASLETEVIMDLVNAPHRVRSVLAVSAVALWFKCGDIANAQKHAHRFLSDQDSLNPEDRVELERILQMCWQNRTMRELESSGNYTEVAPLELKLTGGYVQTGLAPVSVVRNVQEKAYSGIVRTTEHQMRMPFRPTGRASSRINDLLSVFEVPAIQASYGIQFVVASKVAKPQAQIKFGEDSNGACPAGKVVSTFLEYADIVSKQPEHLRNRILDRRYRHALLVTFCELAPDGRQCEQVRLSSNMRGFSQHMVFRAGQRDSIVSAIRKEQTIDQSASVIGILEEVETGDRNPGFEIKVAEPHSQFAEGERVRFHVQEARSADFRKTIWNNGGRLVRVHFKALPVRRYGLQFIAQELSPLLS